MSDLRKSVVENLAKHPAGVQHDHSPKQDGDGVSLSDEDKAHYTQQQRDHGPFDVRQLKADAETYSKRLAQARRELKEIEARMAEVKVTPKIKAAHTVAKREVNSAARQVNVTQYKLELQEKADNPNA